MSGKEENGLAHAAKRSTQIVAIGGAISLAMFMLTWVQAELITKPAARAGSEAVSQVVRDGNDSLKMLVRAEGAIRDNADSLLWQAFRDFGREVRAGVYSKQEIDAMRRASYHRQDSLFNEAIKRRWR